MRIRTAVCCCLPLVAGALVYCARSEDFNVVRSARLGSGPTVVYPTELNLGEREIGEVAIARFDIRNDGDDILIIENVRTDCSCSGLESLSGDSLGRDRPIQIAPGQRLGCQVRFTVRAATGTTDQSTIVFTTNDPTIPQAHIRVLVPSVVGVPLASPNRIFFGEVPIGNCTLAALTLTDPVGKPAKIVEVRNNCSEIAVDLSDIPGRVRVTWRPSRPGKLESIAHFVLAGSPCRTVSVPLFGTALGAIDVRPESIVLPRISSSGYAYEAICVCRCHVGIPFRLHQTNLPKDFAVAVLEAPHSHAISRVLICYTGAIGAERSEIIHLCAELPTQSFRIDIPVRVRKLEDNQ